MSNRKKILIITAVFPPEPVVSAIIAYDIANNLGQNNSVTVLSPPPSRPDGYAFSEPIKSTHFKHIIANSFVHPKSSIIGRLIESYSFGRICSIVIKNSKYDTIYMNSWPLIAQYLTVKASNKMFTPIVTHIQDIYPESLINKLPVFKKFFYKILLPIDKSIIKNSTKVITISNGIKEHLCKTRNVDNKKINVVYNWQNEDLYSVPNIFVNEKHNFTYMFLGTLSPSSSLDTMIHGFIKANIPNSKLIIAGNGPEKLRLELVVKNNCSKNNIEIIDAPIEDAGRIQSRADVMILPLKKGVAKLALPSKIPAYMFSSKPIIASLDIDSDPANVIKKSDCGWVIEPESIDQMSSKMQEVFNLDKNILISKGENGLNYAKSNFSKNINISKISSIIESV